MLYIYTHTHTRKNEYTSGANKKGEKYRYLDNLVTSPMESTKLKSLVLFTKKKINAECWENKELVLKKNMVSEINILFIKIFRCRSA